MGINFAIAIADLTWLTLAGMGLLLPFVALAGERLPRERPAVESWAPRGFALGLGLQSVVLTLTLLLAHRLLYGWLWAVLALAVAALTAGLALYKRPERNGLDATRGASPIEACCLGLALFLFCILARDATRFPIIGYDGVAIWNYKARILFQEGTIWSEAITDPLRVHYHRNYPLLFPLALSTLYRVMGEADEHAVKTLFLATFLALALAVRARVMARSRKPAAGALAALLTIGLPLWQSADRGVLNSGYADLTMALFVFLALAELDAWWQGERRASLALTGVWLGLCWQTKNEGAIILAAALGAGILQALLFKRGRRTRTFVALAGMASTTFLIAAPSLLLTRALPNFYDETYGGAMNLARARIALERLPIILANFKEIVFDDETWGAFWAVYLIAGALGVRRRLRDANVFADAAVLACVAAIAVVFLLTPLHVDFHMKTALPRLLLQIYPFAVYRVACVGAETWDAISAPENSNQPDALESINDSLSSK